MAFHLVGLNFGIRLSLVYMLFLLCMPILGLRYMKDNKPRLSGKNICTYKQREVKTQIVVRQLSRIGKAKSCSWWSSMFGCKSQYRTEYFQGYKQMSIQLYSLAYKCCPGFVEENNECQSACTPGTFGEECSKKCLCSENASSCHHITGLCSCKPGWQGINCTEVCPQNTFGQNCEHFCDCENEAKCNPFTGSCKCLPGWHGEKCDKLCPQGTYGSNCSQICNCPNSVTICHPQNGDCVCPPGFIGTNCAQKCTEGFHGINCSEPCDCRLGNPQRCDNVHGDCYCDPGWDGSKCERECHAFLWGMNCTNQCECNEHTCNPITGECLCSSGFTGEKCERMCRDGFWGVNCSYQCNCTEPKSKCEPINGYCDCAEGKKGENCTEECNTWTFGQSCRYTCDCDEGNTKFCSSYDGSCLCEAGFGGTRCENQINIKPVAPPLASEVVPKISIILIPTFISLILIIAIALITAIFCRRYQIKTNKANVNENSNQVEYNAKFIKGKNSTSDEVEMIPNDIYGVNGGYDFDDNVPDTKTTTSSRIKFKEQNESRPIDGVLDNPIYSISHNNQEGACGRDEKEFDNEIYGFDLQ